MRVSVWSGLGRIGPYVTGVGRHIVNVTRGLASRQGYDVRLILSSEHSAYRSEAQNKSPLGGIPSVEVPFRRRQLEFLWQTAQAPKIDRWTGEIDWIYCPRETYVPVRNARYAITVHDIYEFEKKLQKDKSSIGRWRRAVVLKRALDQATVVFAVSEFTKSRITDVLGTAPEKIRVVGNGVEDEFFQLPANSHLLCRPLESKAYVLSVGGLTRKKGAWHLLNLAEVLAAQAPDMNLVVTGPVEREFEAALNSARNIRHLRRGFPDAEMRNLVSHACASVILSEYEGFGIPALEAMAAGVPVIAAQRAALPEVVGDAGILVDPAPPRAVADAVMAMSPKNDVRRSLIEKGRQRARRFTWGACVARVADALEEFTDSRPIES